MERKEVLEELILKDWILANSGIAKGNPFVMYDLNNETEEVEIDYKLVLVFEELETYLQLMNLNTGTIVETRVYELDYVIETLEELLKEY